MNKDWKYLTLKLGGSYYSYIYDVKEDRIYTRDFPGIDVEPFNLECGTRIKPSILKKIIIDKIIIMDYEMQIALKENNLEQFDKFF